MIASNNTNNLGSKTFSPRLMSLHSLIGMFILINMAMAMEPPASPSASGARSPPPPLFRREEFFGFISREDCGKMSVTAYMHKSLTSKLALNKRSTLTKWAIDGATQPKTWWGKALCATGGFIGGLLCSPLTAGYAGWEYLKNKKFNEQEEITFYWKGGDLWCRLPQKEVLGWNTVVQDTNVVQELSFHQDSKVGGIEGDFDNNKLVILFEKTRGYQTASDRVIEMDKPYTNLKETLLWIRDNQGRRQEYLDESVLRRCRAWLYLQGNNYDESRLSSVSGISSVRVGGSPPPAGRPGLQLQDSYSADSSGMPGTTLRMRDSYSTDNVMPGTTLQDSPISPDSPNAAAEPLRL